MLVTAVLELPGGGDFPQTVVVSPTVCVWHPRGWGGGGRADFVTGTAGAGAHMMNT